jgi:hypothetical protein
MQYDGATLRDVECLVRTPQWRSQHFCLLVLTDYYNTDQSTYYRRFDCTAKLRLFRFNNYRFAGFTTKPQRNSPTRAQLFQSTSCPSLNSPTITPPSG